MKKLNDFLASDVCEAFSISLLICALSLLLMSLISIAVDHNIYHTITLESSYEEEIIPEKILDISEMAVETDNDKSILDNQAMSELSAIDQTTEEIIVSEDVSIESEYPDTIETQLNITELSEQINIGTMLTSQENNLGGVLDRLTLEIIDHAKNKNINVIWLLDASISLSRQRLYIKDRLSKIVSEVKSSENSVKDVKHTICSFGEKLKVISENPSDDVDQLIKEISSINIDESGIENIFSCVEQVCNKFKASRNIIIIFTDEVGDDIQYLDKAIFASRRIGSSIYVVGPPAPFGIAKAQFKYIDPDPKFDQKERWVEINQGPETAFKTTLDLHSLDIDEMVLDSGFGPYGLSRLCLNTEGIYFAMHPNRSKQKVDKKQTEPLSSHISAFFDYAVMRDYNPDYRSFLLQQKEILSNKTKAALVKACSIPLNISYQKNTTFSAMSEGAFVEQLNNAQKFSAQIEPKINEIYSILKEVEASSSLLSEKRWIASYKLAMGRILATKCRIELYNTVLAEAKSGLKKKDKKTNMWTLERADFESSNSQLTKIHTSAIAYLKGVATDYPETPWAAIAQAELDTPMGYKWTESYKEPPKPNMGNNNNNPNVPKDDMIKKLELKPQRKIDKI